MTGTCNETCLRIVRCLLGSSYYFRHFSLFYLQLSSAYIFENFIFDFAVEFLNFQKTILISWSYYLNGCSEDWRLKRPAHLFEEATNWNSVEHNCIDVDLSWSCNGFVNLRIWCLRKSRHLNLLWATTNILIMKFISLMASWILPCEIVNRHSVRLLVGQF